MNIDIAQMESVLNDELEEQMKMRLQLCEAASTFRHHTHSALGKALTLLVNEFVASAAKSDLLHDAIWSARLKDVK